MPFVKGQSGNPAGRPRGCKNKLNREFDEELLKKGEYLTDKLIEHFSEGNATALRLVTQRMAPVTKGRPIEIDLPPLKSPADRPAAVEVINRALCEGEITIDEASGLIKYVDQALGFDHPAVAKGQLVAMAREIAHLRAELAMMAARLDAEFGIDNIKVESTAEGGPADLGDAAEIAAICAKINAEAMIDPPAAEAPVADAPAASEAGIDRINTESIAAEPVAAADDTSGENGVNGPSEINKTNTTPAAAGPSDPAYGTRPVAMTISDDVLALMRELEQRDGVAPDRADVAASQMLAEPSQRQAA